MNIIAGKYLPEYNSVTECSKYSDKVDVVMKGFTIDDEFKIVDCKCKFTLEDYKPMLCAYYTDSRNIKRYECRWFTTDRDEANGMLAHITMEAKKELTEFRNYLNLNFKKQISNEVTD